MKAIAAMSLNRVIGASGKIPWHLPEDFRWFKQTTSGHAVLMGRKTFESLGKPLPNRQNIVLTRGPEIPEVTTIHDLGDLEEAARGNEIFVVGGAEIYRQMVPKCSDLYLTIVQREVSGDTFFPAFEDKFTFAGVLLERPEFRVHHYLANTTS
ncbi:MAG TPA: dihydrofolate reductase [Chthoniobacteraceae bacterium]|jgi:dihydrofolate reductase